MYSYSSSSPHLAMSSSEAAAAQQQQVIPIHMSHITSTLNNFWGLFYLVWALYWVNKLLSKY